MLAQNHLSLEVLPPLLLHGYVGLTWLLLLLPQLSELSNELFSLALHCLNLQCSLLLLCLESCSGRISWSPLPKQHNRKSWKEGNAWSSRGRITQPPFLPFPWSSFLVSPRVGGRDHAWSTGRRGLQEHTVVKGKSEIRLWPLRNCFWVIQFLRSRWSETSYWKS